MDLEHLLRLNVCLCFNFILSEARVLDLFKERMQGAIALKRKAVLVVKT